MPIGSTLRNARVQRGLTIDQVAQDTRISARFLEALEAEMFDQLPAPVYVRGFLRSYANYLRVDPQPLLEELAVTGGASLAGPDAFVRGPSRPGTRGPSRDPFRPNAPAPRPAPSVVVEPGDDHHSEETEEEAWDPEPAMADIADARRGDAVRRSVLPQAEPEPYDTEDYHPRRVEGVLTEREAVYNEGSRGMRLVALAGGAAIVVVFIVVVALLMGGGSDNTPAASATDPSPTPTLRLGTVIAVGSAAPLASVGASPNPSASPSGTPASPTPAETPTPATPTPTKAAAVAAPTATPTPTETPTPTATPTLAVTPFVPTPTPSIAPHKSYYGECEYKDGAYSCGPGPFRVICVPDGTWFVDLPANGIYPAESYGWPVRRAESAGAIPAACS
jgi:cytoskeletal protein RodZ